MSRCNYCVLQAMRAHAATVGDVVTVKRVTHPVSRAHNTVVFTGWDVFIHPPSISEDQLEARDIREEPPAYFAAWFAALTDHCVCGGED